jgi:hypothetical protein
LDVGNLDAEKKEVVPFVAHRRLCGQQIFGRITRISRRRQQLGQSRFFHNFVFSMYICMCVHSYSLIFLSILQF